MTFGLILFITVVAVNLIGLLLDVCLRLTGRRTITQRIEASPNRREWVLLLVEWQLAGAIGLLIHFFA